MEKSVIELFKGYQEFFQKALTNEVGMEQGMSSYASAFISASPAGVSVGENNEQLKQAMQQGFGYYRKIGTKNMLLRNVRTVPIDEFHCLAHVSWTATYDRGNDPDISIDFEVHYFVQQLKGGPKIFGWVSGDEQAVLKRHGII